MKEKSMITVMIGLLFLSFLSTVVLGAQGGGLPDCQNNLNFCTTNLGACTGNLNMCTTNLGVCMTGLTEAQTNLATCQATVTQCIQKTSLPSWDQKLP